MKSQLELFKQNLEIFAKKHKKDINKNPELRKYFQIMCASIGVDPLACMKKLTFLIAILRFKSLFYSNSKQRILGRIVGSGRFLL